MSHRLSWIAAFLVVASLTAGGVLLATSHTAANPTLPVSPVTAPSAGIDYSPGIEPATCPAGCPVQLGDCPTDGHPCVCPNGDHGKCCVMGTSVSCVRNH